MARMKRFEMLAVVFVIFEINFVTPIPVYTNEFSSPPKVEPPGNSANKRKCTLPSQEEIDWDKASGRWYQIMSSLEYPDDGKCFGMNKIKGGNEMMEVEIIEYNIGQKSYRKMRIRGKKYGCKYEWEDFQGSNYEYAGPASEPRIMPYYEKGSDDGSEGNYGSGYDLLGGLGDMMGYMTGDGPGYNSGPRYGSGDGYGNLDNGGFYSGNGMSNYGSEQSFIPNTGPGYQVDDGPNYGSGSGTRWTTFSGDGSFGERDRESKRQIRFIEDMFNGKYVMITDYDNFMIMLMQENVRNKIVVYSRDAHVSSEQFKRLMDTLSDIGEGWDELAMHLSECADFEDGYEPLPEQPPKIDVVIQ
ncbi:uncharacterized protein LOC120347966 isoform X2 [Styela clava]